ncbi:MAG: hypothetical protein ACM3VV_05540 [Deltaproteobacteria bacterium]
MGCRIHFFSTVADLHIQEGLLFNNAFASLYLVNLDGELDMIK